MMNTRCRGHGASAASKPATSGPAARPIKFATDAIRPVEDLPPLAGSSDIHAVAWRCDVRRPTWSDSRPKMNSAAKLPRTDPLAGRYRRKSVFLVHACEKLAKVLPQGAQW